MSGKRGSGRVGANPHMNTSLIEIRRAKAPDAVALASTHDDAWRTAYQGIIPGPELDKLIIADSRLLLKAPATASA